MITENQLEQLCLQWFQSIGYETICGYDIAPDGDVPERNSYQQVILHDRLLSRLNVINPEVPEAALEQVALQLAKPETPILIKNNKAFHQKLLEGVKVEYKADSAKGETDSKTDYVHLIDFDNVVNQYTITGSKGNRRPDVIVFINGLPLSVLELKNPADNTADIWSAYQQLQTYKDEIPDLFAFNEALVVSDGLNARVGSLTANKERFMPWRTVSSENDKPNFEYFLETVVRGFFQPSMLLNYLRHFILFEQSADTTIKKMAGYHQFHAVREAVKATVAATQQAGADAGKAGVVWHTQGSDKSISMVCYAGKLLAQPEMNTPTIVVVTDRNDLDGQLYDTFVMAKDTLKQMPKQVNTRLVTPNTCAMHYRRLRLSGLPERRLIPPIKTHGRSLVIMFRCMIFKMRWMMVQRFRSIMNLAWSSWISTKLI